RQRTPDRRRHAGRVARTGGHTNHDAGRYLPVAGREPGRRMSHPGTLAWFARHESRLAWRDWVAMMTAGRRRRMTTVVVALVAFAALMHLLAYPIVARFASIGPD